MHCTIIGARPILLGWLGGWAACLLWFVVFVGRMRLIRASVCGWCMLWCCGAVVPWCHTFNHRGIVAVICDL